MAVVGAPQHNVNALKHGHDRLKARGLGSLDHRSKPYRDYVAVKQQLAQELGGVDNISRQQAIVIDAISRELGGIDPGALQQGHFAASLR